MTTQHRGTITTWKDDRGFGFITPDPAGPAVFFHIRDVVPPNIRPTLHASVTYTLTYDADQRPRAIMVRMPHHRPAIPIVPVLVAVSFFLLLGLLSLGQLLPVWMLVVYGLLSVVTFGAYALDKASAGAGEVRVPEFSLHVLEVLGGWPGALVAQASYRHKTRKAAFQAVYWGMVVTNLLILALYILWRGFGRIPGT
jgi:uncharacterized membrane protein YsdA (DUF1294 family)/cold shock CspA family protein